METKKYFKDITDSELKGIECFASGQLLLKVRSEIKRRIEENEEVIDTWADRKNKYKIK